MAQPGPYKCCCNNSTECCSLKSGSSHAGSLQSASLQSASLQSGSLYSGSLHSGASTSGSSLHSCSLHSGSSKTCSLHSDNLQSWNFLSGSPRSGSLQSGFPHNGNAQVNSTNSCNLHSRNLHSDSSLLSSARSELLLSQHDLALQAFCKQSLKSRLFRGFYIERRYVDIVQGYRDIVALEKGEQELNKVLSDIHGRVVKFYMQQTKSVRWFGLSFGKLQSAPDQPGCMEAYIWTELKELAYGQYWFSIKSVRFREDEILLKLKMVRLVENEGRQAVLRRRVAASPADLSTTPSNHSQTSKDDSEATEVQLSQAHVGVTEFLDLVRDWGNTIKRSIYNFMANDITKENIVGLLRFLGLLIISLATGAVFLLKNFGIFLLHFMYEVSRLAHVLTPIAIKTIDVLSKTIGGFYILLTMVWKDLLSHWTNRRSAKVENTLKSIDYNVNLMPPRQRKLLAVGYSMNKGRYGEFERKFPM